MGEYIFRMPAGTPDLDFESLTAYLDGRESRAIGATVEVTHEAGAVTGEAHACMVIRLYGLQVARVGRDGVFFPSHGDAHMATTGWLGKIARDNGIGGTVYRIRRRKADPLVPGPRGYMGPLAVDGDRGKLVEGHSYPVDHDRITRNRGFAARWAAEMAFRNAHPDQVQDRISGFWDAEEAQS